MSDSLNNNKSEPDNQRNSKENEFEGMETDEDVDGNTQKEIETGGELIDGSSSMPGEGGRHSGRRRVKIKKRIRIKKKTSSKRKYKKVLERIIWFIFVVGFITALYILFKQLGINDEKYKSTKKRSMIQPIPDIRNRQFSLTFFNTVNKQQLPISDNSI